MTSKEFNKIAVDFYRNGLFAIEDCNLKSGKKSPYYFDFRKIHSDINLQNRLISLFVKFITNKFEQLTATEQDFENFNRVAGVPLGAVPLATCVSSNLNIPLIIPRETPKTYGNRVEIEGGIEFGDDVLLIEDAITTGKSVYNTIKCIERNGGLVRMVVCVLDREEGGVEMLEAEGYKVFSLYKTSKIIDILLGNHIIDEFQYEKVLFYTNTAKTEYARSLKIVLDGEDNPYDGVKTETKYDEILHHTLRSILLKLIIQKKSALCLSLDTDTWTQGRKIIEMCGEYVVAVKTHVDLYKDLGNEISFSTFSKEIREMADKYGFIIMEDRKLCDVDVISWRQMLYGMFRINEWATLITIHGAGSKSILEYYKQQKYNNNMMVNVIPSILLQTNSIDDTVMNTDFTTRCLDVMKGYDNFVPVVVCNCLPNLITKVKMTPGVSLEEGRTEDGRRYRTVEHAMVDDGNHIIIVGGDIIYDDYPDDMARKYAEESWRCFQEAYPKLIEQTNKFFDELIELKLKQTAPESTTTPTDKESTPVVEKKINKIGDEMDEIYKLYPSLQNIIQKNGK